MFLTLSLLDVLQVYLKWLVMLWKLTHGLNSSGLHTKMPVSYLGLVRVRTKATEFSF